MQGEVVEEECRLVGRRLQHEQVLLLVDPAPARRRALPARNEAATIIAPPPVTHLTGVGFSTAFGLGRVDNN